MKTIPLILGFTTVGLITAGAQVVYINPPPGQLLTVGSRGPTDFASRYRVSNSWDMAIISNGTVGTPTENNVNWNLGTFSGQDSLTVSFTLIHRKGTAAAGGGLSWTIAEPPGTGRGAATVLWGTSATFTGTPPVLPVAKAETTLRAISAATGRADDFEANAASRSYNSISVNAHATQTGATASFSGVVFTWQDSGSLGQSGSFPNISVADPAPDRAATLYFQPAAPGTTLIDYNWQLTGNITLDKTGAGGSQSVYVDVLGFRQNFSVVPEPEEYMAVASVAALLGGWMSRRRRARDLQNATHPLPAHSAEAV